ncbi:hypothetical protein BH18ACI5_BH18ACI5_04350 [soil metagenome]
MSRRTRHTLRFEHELGELLTIDQVAAILQVDYRTCRKLIGVQEAEDLEAAAAGRSARTIGLRVLRISERVTRVTEAALEEFLTRR